MFFMKCQNRRQGLRFDGRVFALAGAAVIATSGLSVFGAQKAAAAHHESGEGHKEADAKKKSGKKKLSFKKLFNGKDFTGWKLPEGNEALKHWRIEDGAIVCQNDPTKKGTELWTQEAYGDFVFVTEFKMGTDGVIDSGVFLRTKDQQIQIGLSGSLKRDMTGSIYVPGKGYPKEADGVAELLNATDWNTLRIRAVGATYTVWLNKKKVLVYEEPDKAVDRGPIGLQLHPGNEMTTRFRNIRVAPLDRSESE